MSKTTQILINVNIVNYNACIPLIREIETKIFYKNHITQIKKCIAKLAVKSRNK